MIDFAKMTKRADEIFSKLVPELCLDAKNSKKASIHTHPNHPGDIIKVIPLSCMTADREAEFLKKASDCIDECPRFKEAVTDWTRGFKYIRMSKLNAMTLADFYGEEIEKIPDNVWERVKSIVRKLYMVGIEYVDVTPYNFMIDDDGEIYVIDFGHAYNVTRTSYTEKVLNEKGFKGWNPQFR
jgi:RIO-like serine/threonine protein kinase